MLGYVHRGGGCQAVVSRVVRLLGTMGGRAGSECPRASGSGRRSASSARCWPVPFEPTVTMPMAPRGSVQGTTLGCRHCCVGLDPQRDRGRDLVARLVA